MTVPFIVMFDVTPKKHTYKVLKKYYYITTNVACFVIILAENKMIIYLKPDKSFLRTFLKFELYGSHKSTMTFLQILYSHTKLSIHKSIKKLNINPEYQL